MDLDISVIIPCLNERKTIAEVISSVSRELTASRFTFEVLLVDNGSTDGSDAIASELGARVIQSTAGTVAGVRNQGAGEAKGRLYVFIDADVVVTPQWGKTLREVYDGLVAADDAITGSHCLVPAEMKPLLRAWYRAIAENFRSSYLGTGHMIMSAVVFKQVGGFDETLVTGEDYDFCSRARAKGIRIVENRQLAVYHLGYPESLRGFARREIWHGKGDCQSLKRILSSKIALCGIAFLLININLALLFFVDFTIFLFLFAVAVLISTAFNFLKFRFGSWREFLSRIVVSYIYLLCRGLSLPFYLLGK
jgi:glycosyltransferase involved in cell wall biosynthesis